MIHIYLLPISLYLFFSTMIYQNLSTQTISLVSTDRSWPTPPMDPTPLHTQLNLESNTTMHLLPWKKGSSICFRNEPSAFRSDYLKRNVGTHRHWSFIEHQIPLKMIIPRPGSSMRFSESHRGSNCIPSNLYFIVNWKMKPLNRPCREAWHSMQNCVWGNGSAGIVWRMLWIRLHQKMSSHFHLRHNLQTVWQPSNQALKKNRNWQS